MGLFSGIASFCTNAVNAVKSFFSGGAGTAVTSAVASYMGSSGSHSTTTYDPDRVRAAEIEYDGKIRLTQMERERLEYAKQAQLDIIEAQTESRIAQERARVEGFVRIAEAITLMQERLSVIAEQRLAIIERGTLQAVREAEEFYAELIAEINADNYRYTSEKLSALLEILGRYEEGSPAQKLYMKKIEEDIIIQAEHTSRQLEAVRQRQDRMIAEINADKNRIMEQTDKITAGIADILREKLGELPDVKELPALTS